LRPLLGFLNLVRQHIGHDAYLRRELEWLLATAVEDQLNKESRPASFWLRHFGGADAFLVGIESRLLVSGSNGYKSKVARLWIRRLPEIDLDRLGLRFHPD